MAWYCTISILLALLLFSGYNIYGVVHYRTIPIHLSESYYYFSKYRQKLGWLFPCLMWVMVVLIIPVWIIINLKMQLPHMTYLICIVGAMVVCVGLLREYHDRKIRKWLHYSVAYIAGISSVLWIFITCPTYRYIPFLLLGVFLILGICTRTAIRGFRYWIELVAFYSIMIVLLLLSISFF